MSFPVSMKRLAPYLSRADELETKFPIVSYYCRVYVVESLMADRKVPGYDSQCDLVMMKLLDKCEQAKSKLAAEIENGQVTMEEFSLGVFANADKADRESPIQPPEPGLAGRFYIASLFFDVVSQFFDGVLPPDLEEKRRYAKYRTLQIRNRQPLDKEDAVDLPVTAAPTLAGLTSSASSAKPAGAKPAEATSSSNSVKPVSSASNSGFQYAEEEEIAAPVKPSTAKANPGEARKKLQQAISAIEFADFPTAILLSMEAISLLK